MDTNDPTRPIAPGAPAARGPEPMADEVQCDQCGVFFPLRFAFQRLAFRDSIAHVCSRGCRQTLMQERTPARQHAPRNPFKIAILNQKGGTGKTTTAVNLASGLADEGRRVLLIDMDTQGHVGISLGVRGQRSIYELLVEKADLSTCLVPISPHLDLITADDRLASAEIHLARADEGRHLRLRQALKDARDYDFILLDCGPSLSILNLNALAFADYLLVPVSCDFLSMIGVRQVMKTVKQVNQRLLHPIQLLGVLPTFYDQRNRISDESVKTLRGHFKDKVLHPIRINARLKEAPSHRKSIFEYEPSSRGAEDYRRLVRWLLQAARDRQEKDHGETVRT